MDWTLENTRLSLKVLSFRLSDVEKGTWQNLLQGKWISSWLKKLVNALALRKECTIVLSLTHGSTYLVLVLWFAVSFFLWLPCSTQTAAQILHRGSPVPRVNCPKNEQSKTWPLVRMFTQPFLSLLWPLAMSKKHDHMIQLTNRFISGSTARLNNINSRNQRQCYHQLVNKAAPPVLVRCRTALITING